VVFDLRARYIEISGIMPMIRKACSAGRHGHRLLSLQSGVGDRLS